MSAKTEKIKNIMLYLMERMNNVPMGKTKLMKLLYYVDFDHMEKYGTPVTDATYRKLDHGPVPVEALNQWDLMEFCGSIEVVRRQTGPHHIELRPLPNEQSDVSMLSPTEKEILDSVIERWFYSTAAQMEQASHEEAPWRCTEDGQVIDYQTAFYRFSEDEQEEDRFALSLLKHPRFQQELKDHLSN